MSTSTDLISAWQQYFGGTRWPRIEKQMQLRGLELGLVVQHVTSIRGTQCADNEAAWVICSAHHVIRLCGGVPSLEDAQRLRAALTPTPPEAVVELATKPKRGGKADPAPVPAN